MSHDYRHNLDHDNEPREHIKQQRKTRRYDERNKLRNWQHLDHDTAWDD